MAITELGLQEVSPAKLQRWMRAQGHSISRQHIHAICQQEGIPIAVQQRKTNPCIYCGEPVRIGRSGGPYNKHRECLRRTGDIYTNSYELTCTMCGKGFRRAKSLHKAKRAFCSRVCRDNGQRTGNWELENYDIKFIAKAARNRNGQEKVSREKEAVPA